MKKRRKKVVGLPIGPPQRSVAARLVKPGLAVVGIGAAAVASRRLVTSRQQSGGDPSARARAARADLQRRLKAGDVELEEALALAEKDEALARTRVKLLLQSLPGVGPRGATRAMEEIGIDSSRRIKGLGSHQRAELLDRFASAQDARG